jgi:hypothetical protein
MDEFAWAVGFFEGEGCISLTRYRNVHKEKGYHRSLSVTSTDRENVERFQRAVGVGQIHNPVSHSGRPRHKPIHRWSLTRWQDIEELLLRMRPHLSTRRQEAADLLLAHPVPHGRRGGYGAFCRIVCERGHRLTADTLYIYPNGKRNCKECGRERRRERAAFNEAQSTSRRGSGTKRASESPSASTGSPAGSLSGPGRRPVGSEETA